MIGVELDKGESLSQAIKAVVETKLLGTWRAVIMSCDDVNTLYATTNSGAVYFGRSKDSIILSSTAEVVSSLGKKYVFERLEKNVLYEINENCEVKTEHLQKKMTI